MNDRSEAEKSAKADVGFVKVAAGKDHCRMCVHFQFGHPPKCEVVKGLITWRGWCEKFKRRIRS